MVATLKKFFAFAGEHRAMWRRGILFSVLHSICEALQMGALAVVLHALVFGTMTVATPLVALGLMVASIAGMMVTRYISHTSEMRAAYAMCDDKRIAIGQRLKYMPMGYFNARSLGHITATATTTMGEIEGMAIAAVVRTLQGYIHATVFTLFIFAFDWRIGLIALAGILLFFLANSRLQKQSRKYSGQRQAAQARLVDAALEYIQGITVVKAFNLGSATNRRVDETIQETEKGNYEMEIGLTPYVALQQAVLRLAAVAMVAASIWFTLHGSMHLFACLLMMVGGFMVFNELEQAGTISFMLLTVDVSIDRVEDIHRSPTMDIDGRDIAPKDTTIAFENVDFSYEGRKILDDVSLVIPSGTTTAIVGPSGGGKTTLTSLMARFWDVDAGRVTLGGVDVRDYKLDSLLANVSMVFQSVYLFNDSIANNIKFGRPGATMAEVAEAARRAQCHDFIMKLPGGYDTVIGEGGATLSGGEKQRVSIARAILKDAPVVILDEATANVDPENEAALQEAIEALTRDKTIVMIAHRLKTVQNADQILVVDEGKIVQRGTHEELAAQPGLYADFIGVRKKAIGWKVKGESARQTAAG